MVVAASIIGKAILEICLGPKMEMEMVPGESNIVLISIINIGLFLSNRQARRHAARRLQVEQSVKVLNVLKVFKIPRAPKIPLFMAFELESSQVQLFLWLYQNIEA